MKHVTQSGLMRGMVGLAALFMPSIVQIADAAEHITKDQFVDYYKYYSEGDPRYADLIADDLTFPHVTGRVFHNKQEYVQFYKTMRDSGILETRTPDTIVIDNDSGIVAVEMTTHFTAKPGTSPTMPTGEVLQPGEELEGHNVMFYGIKNGKIIWIRGASTGASKFVRVK